MFCTKCGAELPDDSRFCYKCGSAVTPMTRTDTVYKNDYFSSAPASAPNPISSGTELQQQPTTPDEGMYGILGFVFAFFVPIVGLILSIMGLNKKKNAGLAAAGLIISILYIILAVVVLLLTLEGEFSLFSNW